MLEKPLITLHANYISGNQKKKMRMEESGFWLTTPSENVDYGGPCKAYIPVQPKPVG